jgi:hypothetical protein
MMVTEVPSTLNMVFEGLISMNPTLIWIRFTFLFAIQEKLGPLLVSVIGMMVSVSTFMQLMTALNQLIVVIVLLNLLISMMSKTFEAVKESSLAEFLFEKAFVCRETGTDFKDNSFR